MSRALSLQQASIGYAGNTVLKDITLTIEPGEHIAILGKSGAGKSTLLQHLYEQAPGQCAWCPQEHGLIGSLSIFHNVYMGRLAQHHWAYNLLNLLHPLAREREPVHTLLSQLELPDMRTRVDDLSGGQKQRVALARALHQQAAICIADEPVSALDNRQAGHALSLLNRHYRTTVLALHDVALALTQCQRIIALKDGRIVVDAPAGTLSIEALQWVYD